jgi:membrane complex biogenesis BtpA family protein
LAIVDVSVKVVEEAVGRSYCNDPEGDHKMKRLAMFAAAKPVIGMLHVPALPGSPQNTLGLDAVLKWVLQDARLMANAGIHGFMLENFGDMPFFPRRVPAHTIAFMTALGREVRRQHPLPLGINVLRNDAESALAIAAAVGAAFIRVNIHSGARLTDQGLIEGSAHRTLRYRQLLGSSTKIFADAGVKHSVPLAARTLAEEVEELFTRGCADAVIITGTATGRATAIDDLRTARESARGAPIIAGSGVEPGNVSAVLNVADAVIVGTALKVDGVTTNRADPERVRKFMKSIRG